MRRLRFALMLAVCLRSLDLAIAAPGEVLTEKEIAEGVGGFTGILDPLDLFGVAVASPGDLDGDGLPELAVGAMTDDDGGSGRGAVWILFLEPDGSVRAHQKISQTEGNFGGTLTNGNFFGNGLASLGDLDGDGVGDLAVGAYLDRGAGTDRGAVWIVFLNPDGTVKAEQKIGDQTGGFTGTLNNGDGFGFSVGRIGDLDGDGLPELAVGAIGDDDGGDYLGAVWVLYLSSQGTVRAHQKISATEGDFDAPLQRSPRFGAAVASPGDLDGDGLPDLAVGNQDALTGQGKVWVLFLDADGTVREYSTIGAGQGGFAGTLDPYDNFGASLAALGDLDGDGVDDLAVGAWRDDDAVEDAGAFWILFLNAQGAVSGSQKVSLTEGGFGGTLEPSDLFSSSLAAIGDIDGDGVTEIAAGASGTLSDGAAWILFMDGVPPEPSDDEDDDESDDEGGDEVGDEGHGWRLNKVHRKNAGSGQTSTIELKR